MLNGPQLECLRQTGKLLMIPRLSTGVPATERRRYGWAWDADGNGYFENAGSAVPATAVFFRGFAFTPDGAIYITNSAPGASAKFIDGFYIRADGALHVTTSTSGKETNSLEGADLVDGRVVADFLTPMLPNVTELWSGDRGVTVATGVSAWAGMKGLYTFSQGTVARQPTYNGSEVTTAIASQQWMSATYTRNQPFTRLMVMSPATLTPALTQSFLNDITADVNFFSTNAGAVGINAGSDLLLGTPPAAGAYRIWHGIYNGNSSQIGYNLVTPTTGAAGANNPGGLIFGARVGGDQFAGASYKAIVECDTALTSAQLTQLINAMNAQYAVF